MNRAIVHVASGREWRGGQRQVWLLARELGRRGVDQVVVTGAESELADRLTQSGVRVRPVTWHAGLDFRVLPGVLRELKARPSLLHAHDAHALTLAGLCTGIRKAPLVATRRVTFPLRRTFFWNRARRVIAISSAVRDALAADGLAPDRLVVIPSAVDPGHVRATGIPDIRTQFGLPENGQVAVSLGALTPEKDHVTLVEAAALLVRDLPGLRWVIVGEGPLRARLDRRIAELGLQDRFHLVGQLPDPHLALQGSDVFVLSSTAEGLGSSVLAAMAFDVPVVATRVGGIPEVLGTDGGLLVPARSPSQLASAVLRVLSDEALRVRLTRAARGELARFSVQTVADRVLEVYRSCAHSLDGT